MSLCASVRSAAPRSASRAPHLGLARARCPSAARLSLSALTARASRSTNTRLRGAPRERLDAQRAGAREQVEHAAPLARRRASRTAPPAPGRRSAVSTLPRGAFKRLPPRRPAITRMSPRYRRSSRRRGGPLGATRRSARAPRRRTAARALRPSSACSGARSSGSAATIASARARARSSSSASSGRRATWNWPRPDWRVPDQLALAAQLQVDLGQAEAVGVLVQRAQPDRARRRRRPDEQAARTVLAAPDPPAQLVQLGDPEALGVLDQHHGRVGHVDPDLDHGRRHQHVGLAARRTRPSPPASRAGACRRAAAPARSPAARPRAGAPARRSPHACRPACARAPPPRRRPSGSSISGHTT